MELSEMHTDQPKVSLTSLRVLPRPTGQQEEQNNRGILEDGPVGQNHNRRLLGVWPRDFSEFSSSLFVDWN